jgi:(p)ppGpp synthase/HD superfamily hydrolase
MNDSADMDIETGAALETDRMTGSPAHLQGSAGLADRMLDAWDFAATLHNAQRVPGTDLPYLKHLGMVTMEIYSAHALSPVPDLDLAIVCAILHDSIEDQGVTHGALSARFGPAVADGVQALSKDPALPKAEAMIDSLARIRAQPAAIWCVKLADRISNLRGAPAHWSGARIEAYREEAKRIHAGLAPAHTLLGARLAEKIVAYPS